MRGRGGYIGFNRVPAAAALNSAASGVWTLREAESLKRGGTWPLPLAYLTSIAGLQLWLDAADSTTLFDATSGGSLVAADGGVARWEDKSGNGKHAIQSTSLNRPLRKTSVQSGLDAIRFDGSNDSMQLVSDVDLLPTQSLFVVLKPTSAITSATTGQNVLQGGLSPTPPSATTSQFFLGFGSITGTATNETVGWYVAALSDDNSALGVFGNYSQTNVTDSAQLFSYTYGGTTINTFSGRRNVSQDFTILTTSEQGHWRQADMQYPTKIQRVGSNVSSSFFNGDIFEIVVYNSQLSSANRTLVENYLLAKWGIV